MCTVKLYNTTYVFMKYIIDMLVLFLCRKFSIDNCLLSNVNLGFYDNLDDVLADSQWDLYRQSNDFQCSTDSGGSGGMYKPNLYYY